MGPECESCLVRILCFRVSYKTAVQVSARIKVLSQDIDAFELWCWRRLLRVLWTVRRSNQSILKKSTLNTHRKDWCWSWSWSWSSSILVTWCEQVAVPPVPPVPMFHLFQWTFPHWKSSWCWKRLRAEREEGGKEWITGWHHQCSGYELGQTPGDGKGQGGLACGSPWGRRVRHDWATEQQLKTWLGKDLLPGSLTWLLVEFSVLLDVGQRLPPVPCHAGLPSIIACFIKTRERESASKTDLA